MSETPRQKLTPPLRSKPRMTARHFSLIADVLREANLSHLASHEEMARIVELFASNLEHTNPKFDKVKFLKAYNRFALI